MLEFLSKRLFTKPTLDPNGVVETLVLQQATAEGKLLEILPHQVKFFDQTLKRTIHRMSSDHLSLFVFFCTGYYYLPHRNPSAPESFAIYVEFNFAEMPDEESLPVAHTCQNLLKLPGMAYENNDEVFWQKLTTSMAHTKNVMSMN